MAEEEVVAEVSHEPSDHHKRKLEDLAEEEVVAEVSSETSDHQKRKLEDLELPETEAPAVDPNAKSNIASIMGLMKEEEEAVEEAVNGNGEAEAKRPRLEEDHKADATENGYQEEKVDEPNEEVVEVPPVENNISEDTQEPSEKESVTVQNEEQPSDENPQLENAEGEPSKEEFKEPQQENQVLPVEAVSVSQQGDVSYVEQQPVSESQTMSRKIEVPNAKVGVLIGKAGDTIRYMQLNSGARIQITRDADADPNAPTRPVELIGSLENINKAERLIKDVIAEADAGGSPALVARGFNTVQSSGAGEQIEIQVPIEKVGLILGKGGETIKNLQTRSGTRIQLIPQRLPEGDQSRERTVRVIGDKKQVEMAAEMIKEVMNQHMRPSPLSSGYNQGSRPRGPTSSQWGPQGPRPSHQTGYDYAQRGPPYPSQNPQMPPAYGNYPPQQMDPRTNFNRDQRPPPSAMQGPPPQGGSYNYYSGQAGPTPFGPPSNPAYSRGPGPTTAGPVHSNYNYGQPQGLDYGQPQGLDYGQPAPYSQTTPPAQSYGHAPQQNPYGGHTAPQQSAYPQGGYGLQDQYGKPPHAQSYALPRANQPGDIPYQGPPPSTQSYNPNVPTQQPYPYASSGPPQQTYPPYGSAPIADGFNQQPATTTPAPSYQGGQPYVQQAPVYSQAGPTGGYGSYPSSQLGYPEQAAPNSEGYGYQGPADPAYSAGPGAYGAPPPVQPGYDQSVPQSGGYGTVPGAVPVGYGKGLSPQPGYPQYDASQMHGAPR